MSLRRLFRSAMTSLTDAITNSAPRAPTSAMADPTTPTPSPSPRVPIPPRGLDYRNKIVLAPMVRSGELPSRLLALSYGADLVWGPETVDRAIIGCARRVNPRTGVIEYARMPSNGGRRDGQLTEHAQQESIIYKIDPARESGRLVFQIGSSCAATAVAAARTVAPDVNGIDLNAGCPKPFSTSGGMGAALLQTPDTLVDILTNLVTHVGTPFQIGISVKIRILADPEATRALVSRLVKTGILGLTVHCRTTPMRPREPAVREQLPMIRDICRAAGVACLVNGDVVDRDHARRLMAEYDVDGAMIATAAEANSSCFRAGADGGLACWREVVHRYIDLAMQVENKWGNTKYLLNMLVPGKGKDKVYNSAKSTQSYQDCCLLLGFEDLLERARECDRIVGRAGRLGLESPELKAQMEVFGRREEKNLAIEKVIQEHETARAAEEEIKDLREKVLRASSGPGSIRSGTAVPGKEAEEESRAAVAA